MVQVNRITGGSDEFISLIRGIQARVSNLETRGTGTIYVSDQIITQDPTTGVETIFGALPDGTHGFQQWVNDTEPPNAPSTPVVAGDRAVFEITWDGMDKDGFNQPTDYDRTVVQMSTTSPDAGPAWVEVNYFIAAGRVVVGGQPYGEPRFFRLISYDKNGNASAPSAYASATLVSFLESPEMTTYIGGVETKISNANTAASEAQTAAQTAAEKAANAEQLAQAAANNATSMVKNGSFELDFESWTKEGTNGSISTTTAYDGTKSWEIGTTGSGIYQAPIPVSEGDIFVYEMHYKTIAGFAGSGGLRLQTSTDGVNFTNNVNGQCTENIDWVPQSVEYTVPAGVTHIRPRIAFAAASTMGVWVDVVKLTDVSDVRRLEKLAQDAKDIADAAALEASDAARDAGNALTAANGKNTSWHQDITPAGTTHRVNDIWFNTADGNKIHIWNGTDWIASRDTGIDQALSDAYDAEVAAATAAQAASDAASKADTATSTANTATSTANAAKQAAIDAEANAKAEAERLAGLAQQAAIDAASLDATSKMETAESNAAIEAARVAQEKAETAESDAIAAAQLYADTKASDAGSAAIEAAKLDATNKANAAKQAAIDAAALDASAKAETAESNAAIEAARVAKEKADQALLDAQEADKAIKNIADAASTNATDALNTAGAASTKAENAFTAANGKNKITPSFNAAPTVYEGASGDMWWQKSTTAPYEIIKQSTWNGTTWDTQTLGNNTISNLNASKINAGTIASERIGADSITAEKMATGTITADSGIIASLDAAVITVGELEGARIKAGTLLADRLVVGTGDNLIADPDFTTGTALTNARLAGATAGATKTTPDYIGWNKTALSATVHSLKLGGQSSDVLKPVMPVIANRRYKTSWTVYADAITSTSTRATYRWLNRDGTITSAVGADKPLTATGLTSYVDEVVVPAEATHVALALEFTRHPGGGWLDFRQPIMQLMTDGTVITEDAVTAKHIQAGEITGDVLDMGYIKGQIITANMFEGATFSGGIFQDATFQTSPLANTGIKMSPSLGLVGYNTSQQPVFQVDPSGNAMFTGKVIVTDGSSVPQNAITGLATTLSGYDSAVATVQSWAHPNNTTLIDGGHIATNSITANQIALGAGQNFIPGGDGGDRTGWDNFGYADTSSAWPSNVVSLYSLEGAKIAYSPSFNVAGLNKYSFSYIFVGSGAGIYHETAVCFYDINGTFISMVKLGRKTSDHAWGVGSGSVSNQSAPVNAVTAKVYVEHNWQTGDALGSTRFGNFLLTTGVETRLTSSGLTSYNSGVQTLRLNGEKNLMIGEVMTGRPDIEPYIKLASNANVAGIEFYSIKNTNQSNHGAMWWQTNVDDLGLGELKIYAMDDPPEQAGNRYYAAGIELRSSGRIEFHGKLDHKSETFKVGSITWSGGFTAKGVGTSSYGTYYIAFPVPFPSGTVPRIITSMEASAGAEMNATVKTVDHAGFYVTVVNMSPRTSGFTRMTYFAIKDVYNA